MAWHWLVAPARTRSIRWTGPQLHTDQGTAYLDEPGARVALEHGRFGTSLTVDDGQTPLVLHGDHGLLAPLADAPGERLARAETTEEEAREAAAWARQVRAHAVEKAR